MQAAPVGGLFFGDTRAVAHGPHSTAAPLPPLTMGSAATEAGRRLKLRRAAAAPCRASAA